MLESIVIRLFIVSETVKSLSIDDLYHRLQKDMLLHCQPQSTYLQYKGQMEQLEIRLHWQRLSI